MPYILKINRAKYDKAINQIVERLCDEDDEDDVPGRINYVLFSIVFRYLKRHGIRYYVLNGIMGAIECCKQELYRRVIGPYENKAIEKNGDVE